VPLSVAGTTTTNYREIVVGAIQFQSAQERFACTNPSRSRIMLNFLAANQRATLADLKSSRRRGARGINAVTPAFAFLAWQAAALATGLRPGDEAQFMRLHQAGMRGHHAHAEAVGAAFGRGELKFRFIQSPYQSHHRAMWSLTAAPIQKLAKSVAT
jgi:hypothetical protein